jgi:hypothetical protein
MTLTDSHPPSRWAPTANLWFTEGARGRIARITLPLNGSFPSPTRAPFTVSMRSFTASFTRAGTWAS